MLAGWQRAAPLLGAMLAAALVISRRPDAILHAQFWAEDGSMFFHDVYQHGLVTTLLVPQSGYFQELPILTAWLAQRLVPLTLAPLFMNSVAIAVRVLPVGLLLSQRARTISPDLRVRSLLAVLYIALPGIPETDANIDNALWYLAVAALLVIMLAPAQRPATRIFDALVVLLCAVTGVFSIALAPLAFLYRRQRGPQSVPRSTLAILAVGAALQLLAILVLEYHVPSGYQAYARSSVALRATPTLLFQIVGLRVFAAGVVGASGASMVSASVAMLIGMAGALIGVLAMRRGSAELRLIVLFGAAILCMALAHPLDASWPQLVAPPDTDSARYFLIPELAAATLIVWTAAQIRTPSLRLTAIAAVTLACAYGITTQWRYTPLTTSTFTHEATVFEHAAPGTRMVFPLAPGPPWTMTLVKR